MKKIILILTLMAMGTLFTGCYIEQSNRQLRDQSFVEQTIKKGVTKQGIKAKLGSPSEIQTDSNGYETWIYTSKGLEVNALGLVNNDYVNIDILFSKSGHVIKYNKTERN